MEHAKSAALASDEGIEGSVPVILHRAMGQTLSVVQDYFNEKVIKMVVDSPRTFHEVTSYLQEIAPDLCDRVKSYTKRSPLFDEFNIEGEIANKRLVYEEAKKAVARDRFMVKVSELSKHGLMETTRKRVRPSVTSMVTEPCTCCHATGRVEALETSFSKIEQEICRLLAKMEPKP